MGWAVSQLINRCGSVGCSVAERTKICRLGPLFLFILAITSKRVWPAQGRVGIILLLRMQQVRSEAA